MFKDMELPAKNFLMFAADEFKGIEELKTEDVAKICGYDAIRTNQATFYLIQHGYIVVTKGKHDRISTPVKFQITDEGYKWINRTKSILP